MGHSTQCEMPIKHQQQYLPQAKALACKQEIKSSLITLQSKHQWCGVAVHCTKCLVGTSVTMAWTGDIATLVVAKAVCLCIPCAFMTSNVTACMGIYVAIVVIASVALRLSSGSSLLQISAPRVCWALKVVTCRLSQSNLLSVTLLLPPP